MSTWEEPKALLRETDVSASPVLAFSKPGARPEPQARAAALQAERVDAGAWCTGQGGPDPPAEQAQGQKAELRSA